MTRLRESKKIGTLILICLAVRVAAFAQTFSTVATFNLTDGAQPEYISLVQGTNGSFYGTTEGGGGYGPCFYINGGCGTVFEVTPSGELTKLYSFCQQTNCTDGAEPWAGLALAVGGKLYGTTFEGGALNYGSIFTLTDSGSLITLHSFNGSDGSFLEGDLVQGVDGNFYGVTGGGGVFHSSCSGGCGTIFQMTPDGTLTTIHDFDFTDGFAPIGGLILGTDGNLYGTTFAGGLGPPQCYDGQGCGTVFKITPSGKLTSLHLFCSESNCTDGANPIGPLSEGADGNFYGTTEVGGGSGSSGTVFKITPSGALTSLHSFAGDPSDGASPYAGLVQATDGKFYGATTSGGECCGNIFSITADGTYTNLYDFGVQYGYGPMGGMIQGTDGSLYGTTPLGAPGFGTVFKLDMGLGPFVTFIRSVGKVEDVGPIIGQGLTGTSSVAINGIEASFTVVSDTHIQATVPPGATTGYVTVTTPTGVLTSNVPFHVIQ